MSEFLRILLCSHNPLTREYGAPKVLMELSSEMQTLGWQIEFVSPPDLGLEHTTGIVAQRAFSQRLRNYLIQNAGNFDVIDYEHEFLPFSRNDFSARSLMVARSVLLIDHFQVLPIPKVPGMRAVITRFLHGPQRRLELSERIANATITLEQADLINVSNDDDKSELIRRSIDPAKIVVIPFGISPSRLSAFDAITRSEQGPPNVAFVGTFDFRKGAREFPDIVRALTAQIPEVRFKLLGTKGQFTTRQAVESFFSASQRSQLIVHPTFSVDELPLLLSDCSVGVFPSHIEGFPFGVLEMLAGSLPVFAYDAPGPPMMLPREWLTARGDGIGIAVKAAAMLKDKNKLKAAQLLARTIAGRFPWRAAAEMTDLYYRKALQGHRSGM